VQISAVDNFSQNRKIGRAKKARERLSR